MYGRSSINSYSKTKSRAHRSTGKTRITHKKGAFEDVPYKIKFNLLEEENIKPLVRDIKVWLMNGKTLYFTDDEVYRKIKHVEIGDIANEIEEFGEFEVEFTLDPFEYVESVPFVITKSETFMNIGTYESAPKFEIFGNGDVRIMINDVSFQIKGVTNSVIVDSELLIAYEGTKPIKTVGSFLFSKLEKIQLHGLEM